MASYNSQCCITQINLPELLIAGHISPWSADDKNRLNPRNGLLLNCLHDKAFENGLISINSNYEIVVSSEIKQNKNHKGVRDYFLKFEGKSIFLPSKFLPAKEFLNDHYEDRFRK